MWIQWCRVTQFCWYTISSCHGLMHDENDRNVRGYAWFQHVADGIDQTKSKSNLTLLKMHFAGE